MTQMRWYLSANEARPWNIPIEDWLYIRTDESGAVQSLWLRDDTDHEFTELHVFDSDGRPVVTQVPLESANGVTELSLRAWPGCSVLAKVSFLALRTSPFVFDKIPAAISCGEVVDDEGIVPIPLQFSPERADPKGAAKLPASATAAHQYFTVTPAQPVRASLRAGKRAAMPFSQVHYSSFVTRVYFLSANPLPDIPAKSGEIDMALLADFNHCVIPPLKTFPEAPKVPADAKIALPVTITEAGTGLVGTPFALVPLFTGLALRKLKEVSLTWKWLPNPPTEYMRVLWCLYSDDPENPLSSEYRPKDVNPQTYAKTRGVTLFTRSREHANFCVGAIATPLLFGREVSNARATCSTRL